MSTTRTSKTNRLAMLAAVVFAGLSLLAGCSEEPPTGRQAAHSVQASNNADAASEQREAVFSVPGMDCPMCPITVKRALGGADGVVEAEADLDTKEARAVFDPSRTNTDALITAIESSGFSAQLKEQDYE
ncbi:MAG: cation transporter [Gammaproteobacteria bacterium]